MADGAAGKEAVSVVSKRLGLGKKNPPALEAELSNGNLLVIRIDDVLGLTSFRLYSGTDDVIGKDVFKWWTGLGSDEVDTLLEEVKASNFDWWMDHAATDMFAGTDL